MADTLAPTKDGVTFILHDPSVLYEITVNHTKVIIILTDFDIILYLIFLTPLYNERGFLERQVVS